MWSSATSSPLLHVRTELTLGCVSPPRVPLQGHVGYFGSVALACNFGKFVSILHKATESSFKQEDIKKFLP